MIRTVPSVMRAWKIPITLVRHSHQPEGLAAMPQLSARLLPAPLPQALRLPFQPVAGGRLGAIVTILGQPPFQLVHPLQQQPVLHQRRLQLLAELAIFGCDRCNSLVLAHASILRSLHKSG